MRCPWKGSEAVAAASSRPMHGSVAAAVRKDCVQVEEDADDDNDGAWQWPEPGADQVEQWLCDQAQEEPNQGGQDIRTSKRGPVGDELGSLSEAAWGTANQAQLDEAVMRAPALAQQLLCQNSCSPPAPAQ